MRAQRAGLKSFVAVARACLDESVAYSQVRKTFGKPICEHQSIQIKLAEMATRLEASRLLVEAAASPEADDREVAALVREGRVLVAVDRQAHLLAEPARERGVSLDPATASR